MEWGDLQEVIATALRLLLGAGVPIWMVVLAAVGCALLLVMAPRFGRRVVAFVKAIKVEPQTVADENGPQPPGVSVPTGRPDENESGSGG